MNIDDNYIIHYFFDKNLKKINPNKTKNIPKEIWDYLNNRFLDAKSLREIIFRIKYQVEYHPVCPICGKPNKWVGHIPDKLFSKACSKDCANILRKQSTLLTVREKYHVDNVF